MIENFLSKLGFLEAPQSNNFIYIFIHVGKAAGTTIGKTISQHYREKSLPLYDNRLLKYIESKHGNLDIIDNLSRSYGYTDLVSSIKDRIINKEMVTDLIKSLPASQRDSIQCIYGHLAYYGIHELFNKEPRYFAFLRNSVNRTLSRYNYLLSKSPERQKFFKVMREDGKIFPFEEWLENYPYVSNRMVWFLSQRYAGEVMNHHHVIPDEQDLENAKNLLDKLYFIGLTERSQDFEFIYNRLGINSYLSDQNISRKFFIPEEPQTIQKKILAKNQLDLQLYDYAVKLNRKICSQIRDYNRSVLSTQARRVISKTKQLIKQRYH
jgi:hypothetical protein